MGAASPPRLRWAPKGSGWAPGSSPPVEAYAPVNYKQEIIEIGDEGTTITRCHSGKPCRLIRNRFTDSWVGWESEILPFPLQSMRVGFKLAELARYEGKIEEGGLACGQTAGMINSIRPVSQIVRDVMAEAAQALIDRFEKP
jgi:enoyl-[acyl-carrier protein] reductase II